MCLLVSFEFVKCNDHLVQFLLLVVDIRFELFPCVKCLVVLRFDSGKFGFRVNPRFDYLD